MVVTRSFMSLVACALLLACGGGSRPAPGPVGTENPAPDPQQPEAASQAPAPDPQAPLIGSEEPLPNPLDPAPSDGEGGASADDR